MILSTPTIAKCDQILKKMIFKMMEVEEKEKERQGVYVGERMKRWK